MRPIFEIIAWKYQANLNHLQLKLYNHLNILDLVIPLHH